MYYVDKFCCYESSMSKLSWVGEITSSSRTSQGGKIVKTPNFVS